MTTEAMKELDYGLTTAIGALIQALGMHWENERCKLMEQTPSYSEGHFQELIEKNGLHHNAVLTRWEGIQ